jgi:hypothetical protein
MIDQKLHQSSPTARLSPEQRRAQDERSTVWAFVWTLFAFKVATIVAIAWAASGSKESVVILAATNWFWLLIPAFAVAGPLAWHYRLRRAKRRREALLRAEWMVE